MCECGVRRAARAQFFRKLPGLQLATGPARCRSDRQKASPDARRKRRPVCRAAMPVEEQIFETAAASNGALEKGVAGKEHDAANGHGDAGGEEFEELGDLETVDVTGGALLQHLPETHVHAQGGDDEAQDPLAMNPDLLPDSSHLSASATPDKAREIEAISERIIILHEHLQKSNVIFLPAPCCTSFHPPV